MRKIVALMLVWCILGGSAEAYCFREAAKAYKIDPILLISIADGESSLNYLAQGVNRKNGVAVSEDIGVMQINSAWLKNDWFKENKITRERLYRDPCLNVMVGTRILAAGCDIKSLSWDCIGAYNAGDRKGRERLRYKYSVKVHKKYKLLKTNPMELNRVLSRIPKWYYSMRGQHGSQ